MRVYGITYDTGFVSGGTTTHEPFDPDVVRRDMRVIREELGCDAVRVTGGVADRLEVAARCAVEAGLEVWYSPFTNGLTQDELAAFLVDAAERAERLRREGGGIVLLSGSEISLFSDGFLPGSGLEERVAVLGDPERLRSAHPELHRRVNAFFARVVPELRARFGGLVGYASLPFEGVDRALFDLGATDAGYRDAATAADFRRGIRARTGGDMPFAVTEFGCVTYRGAADRGGRGEAVVEWDDRARPVRLTEVLERDEEEQARYVIELLGIYDEEGVDAAFVNTFARRDLPGSDDPERDFDIASFGVVKVLEGGGWEPKAAFRALAEYGRARRSGS